MYFAGGFGNVTTLESDVRWEEDNSKEAYVPPRTMATRKQPRSRSQTKMQMNAKTRPYKKLHLA